MHEFGRGRDFAIVHYGQQIDERGRVYKTIWTKDELPPGVHSLLECIALGLRPLKTERFEGNILLNEGINELWTILCSSGGTKYDNTNAQLGVGNGTAAENATHTDLQGASVAWKGMNAGYPTYGSAQKATWQSDFGAAEGNFAWEEFSVRNGATANKNLNRKVVSKGTKSGGTWTLTLDITLS